MKGRLMSCLLATAMSAAAPAKAQITTADMEILSIAHKADTGGYQCDVVIRNQNDDSAVDINLIILLPNQVTVRQPLPAGCTAGQPVPGGVWNAFVQCSVKDLPPEATCKADEKKRFTPAECESRSRRAFTIKTTTPAGNAAKPTYKKNCAAFVWNRTGDHERHTNFKVSP